MRLTPSGIDRIKPRSTRFDVPDNAVRGLVLAIFPSGTKSWSVRLMRNRRFIRYSIGKWPTVNIVTARKAASDVLRRYAIGEQPQKDKLEKRRREVLGLDRAETFATVWQQYLDRHVDRHTQPRTAKEYKRFGKKHFLPTLRRRNITDITPKECKAIFDRLRKRAPVSANRSFAALRAFFVWVEAELIAANPMKTLTKPTAKEGDGRTRVLDNEELKHLWAACVAVDHPFPFGHIVRGLMLTGCRLSEISALKSDWVNQVTNTIVIPKTKNHRAHTLPIVPALNTILNDCPTGGDYVFTTNKRPPSGFSRAKKRIDLKMAELMGDAFEQFAPYTWHDIRRSVASGLLKLGFNPVEIDAVLNHKSGTISGLRATYMQFDAAEITKRALTSWADHLKQIIGG
jgi:integrase